MAPWWPEVTVHPATNSHLRVPSDLEAQVSPGRPPWPAAPSLPAGHEAVKAFAASWLRGAAGLISQLAGRGRRREGLAWNRGKLFSGAPKCGGAAQREPLPPRNLIIFNPGRRKEGGQGEGLRKEERRGRERRGKERGEEQGGAEGGWERG